MAFSPAPAPRPAQPFVETTETLQQNLAEIRRLLSEAYEHYFAGSDGHCKSLEGQISIDYPEFFWRLDAGDPAASPRISIYSYVFARGRREHFENSQEALDTVREWHAEEMGTVYCAKCVADASDCYCAPHNQEGWSQP